MSKAELRQLCVDFMELQLSFQWKTDMDLSFHQTNNDKGKLKNITTDNIPVGCFTYTGDSITYAQLVAMTVGSNYSISDVFVTVTDSSGKELARNVYRFERAYIREVSMLDGNATWKTDTQGNRLTMTDGMEVYANGQNTVTVTM